MVTKDGKFDRRCMYKTVCTALRMLDNVIDTFDIPVERVQDTALLTRRCGLGLMGVAEYLLKRNIGYGSDEAIREIHRVMRVFKDGVIDTTRKLACEKGDFPAWPDSIYAKYGDHRRNAYTSSVAPTGTTSMIVTPEISSGIEPPFAWAFVKKNILGGAVLEYGCHYLLRAALEQRGLATTEILDQIAKEGTLQHIAAIPEDLKAVFRSAHDVTPEEHVKMQAAFQENIDNAISKTCNLPFTATVTDIMQIYELAHRLGCKGLTIYRNGSRVDQVLELPSEHNDKKRMHSSGDSASGSSSDELFEALQKKQKRMMMCPECISTEMIHAEGCCTCPKCGNSLCGM